MTALSERAQPPTRPPAFSRLLVVDEVPDDGIERTIEADPAECSAVAAETGLPTIHALSARYEISRLSGGRLRVEGAVRASINQICVVSLDPFDSEVTQAVDVAFARPSTEGGADRRLPGRGAATSRRRPGTEAPGTLAPVRVVEGEADPPDPIVEGRIDLGALAVEFLTLALDIYPRKPGAQFPDVVVDETSDATPSAFAALARLKDRA